MRFCSALAQIEDLRILRASTWMLRRKENDDSKVTAEILDWNVKKF